MREYRDALERKADDEIAESLRKAPSAQAYRCLWRALEAAILAAGTAPDTVAMRAFALPILIVVGGRPNAVVPGVAPDVGRLTEVLQRSGVLGQARNFWLGNALCSIEALESLKPSRLYALGQAFSADSLDLPPADIPVARGDGQVHLRFLLGGAVVPTDAPSFLETGSAVAAWGLPLTRELADQLRVDGVSLLAIPRPPAAILQAMVAGRRAREEMALQLFASRVLRSLRAEVGEPRAAVAPLDSGAIGVHLTSRLAEDRTALHEWNLHPIDDLREVVGTILDLLHECRVEDVTVIPSIVPAQAFAR